MVTDPDGAALPGVTVVARNEATGATRTVVTGATGNYRFQGMTPAVYTVTFTLTGFRGIERPGVQLRVGQEPDLNVTLELSSVEETITVTAQTPMVETTSKEVGGSLTVNEIEDLPSINRSFILFASLLPGVVASEGTGTVSSDVIFVNGQDDQVNQFNIDGAANDDQQNGGNAGGQVRAAFDAMQEFQILTSQFDAEFGRSTGAVVNAVTKSGSNEIHGTGFYFAQNNSWNALPFFVERAGFTKDTQPDVDFKGLGGTIGGPIVENRTHYFASYEYLTPNEAVARVFEERPGGQFDFATSEQNRTHNVVLKLDHQLTDNNKMAVRWLWEYQPQFNQSGGAAQILENLDAERDTDQGVVGSLDTVLSNTTFNNLRVSFTRENVNFINMRFRNACFDASGQAAFECQASFPPLLDYPGIEEGFDTRHFARIDNSLQFDDTVSTYIPSERWGDHDLRFGASYWVRKVHANNAVNANGDFNFPSSAQFDVNDTSTYPEFFDILIGGSTGSFPEQETPRTNIFGIFLQDDWQPIPNLTLNLGVRYDWETITNDNNNIGPRVGFAWDPVGDGRTTLRGGYGRFYMAYLTGLYDDQFQDAVASTRGIEVPWIDNDCQQCFIDLIQQNGFTDLTQVRDHLKQVILDRIASGETPFNSSPSVDWPDRVAPHTDNLTLGFEREVIDNVSIGVDWVHLRNRGLLQFVDLNDFSRTQGRPNISIFNGATPSFGSINTRVNGGMNNYHALQLSLIKRQSRTRVGVLGGRLSYTLARQKGNTDGFSNDDAYFQRFAMTGWNFDTGEPINPGNLDLGLDHPQNVDRPGNNARTHNFVLSGNWMIPGTAWRDNGGIVLSGIFRYLTGSRYTIVVNDRLDNNNRQVAPAGSYSANNPNDISFSNVAFDGTLRGAAEPHTAFTDLSVRYRIPFGDTVTATVLVDMFNLFDSTRFSNVGQTRTSLSGFLIPTAAFPNRELQIGLRLNY